MAEAARNEWHLSDVVIARLETYAVIEPLDRTPYRQPCQVGGCSKQSLRERVIGQEHPYVFSCEYGHTVATPALFS